MAYIRFPCHKIKWEDQIIAMFLSARQPKALNSETTLAQVTLYVCFRYMLTFPKAVILYIFNQDMTKKLLIGQNATSYFIIYFIGNKFHL